MANENPDLYTIRLGVRQVASAVTKDPITAKLTVDVTRRPQAGGKAAAVDDYGWDGITLIVRPGDYVQFELGDVDFKTSAEPTLHIEWKTRGGRGWPEAPTAFGQPVQIPPRQGYGLQHLSWRAELDFGQDLELPSQVKSARGTTIVSLDPDIIVDES